MPLSKEKEDQIELQAFAFSQSRNSDSPAYKAGCSWGYYNGAAEEAEKALCLIEALKKIAYGYDNDDTRPGVHIGYSGAQSIATAALQSYTNSLK